MALSSSKVGFGVVSSLLPAKIELAPAIKQKACSGIVISARPALSLTMDFGINILAVAIMRTISQISTFGLFSRGVPLIRTSALIGTLSGCSGRVDRV